MTFGLLLLLASLRPELQRRPGEDSAPASKVALAGHILTWTPGTILVYRMVRSVIQHGRDEHPSDQG